MLSPERSRSEQVEIDELSLVSTESIRDQLAASASDREHHISQLGDAIATLAARLHAATYELLVMLREFDACAGWNNGFLWCAHWLHWRTGIDLGASREKVRVARALAALPCISAAMQRGEVSYAKVRALTRIATPANESRLVEVALAATASQIERLVRAWRRVDQVEAAQQTEQRHLHRSVTMHVDDDGMVVLRGRLTPEIGAIVQRAIEAAADRLFSECANASPCDGIAGEVTPAQRRADALGLLVECALSADLDHGTTGGTTMQMRAGRRRGVSTLHRARVVRRSMQGGCSTFYAVSRDTAESHF